MNLTITKNHKNISILHKLISSGHYKGVIKSDGFELKRKNFPNNFEIIGILAENEKFFLQSVFKKPQKYFVKAFNILGVLVSLGLFFVKSNWIVAVLYFVIRVISHVYVRVKSTKEMEIFTGKFLEFESVMKK